MKPRIWVEGNLVESALERLRASAEVVRSTNIGDLAGADGAVLGAQIQADSTFIERAGESLAVIARIGIGVDNVDAHAATRSGVLVVNTPDGPTESTAEHTIALLLSLAKRIVRSHQSLTGRPAEKRELFGTELKGKQIGVVGYGRIGWRVAEICRAGLGMQVVVFDPFVPHSALHADERAASSLQELLAGSDVVTLHSALTPETRHLIGASELRSMKPTAYLINASRGPVVDEAALLAHLRERRIAGAAIDVFEVEPPETSNPLFELDNIVVTPHVASFTDLGVEKMGQGVVDQLEAIFRGERPQNLVNPAAWPGRAAAKGWATR